tara:strand:+ start:975 stop:2381 length:1407 start_codon:yes stop_codon:yes gene_type:complete
MGFLSKLVKPFKKVFKKIGKGIKSAFKKFGKFMNKLGPLGTIAMGFLLPGIGFSLGGAWSGLAGTLAGSSNALLSTVGNFMTKAASMGSAVSGTVSNITGAVTDVLKESVRAIGKQVGLGKLGPEGMKAFFNKSTGDFMGTDGFLDSVQKKFGSRLKEVSGKWGHFRDHLTKTNQMYRDELLSGTYEPYKGYIQHDSMLKGKMSDKLQTGITNVKENLLQERSKFLEGVDLKTDEGKFLKETFDDYERSIFQSPGDEFGRNKTFYSPEDVIENWSDNVPGYEQFRENQLVGQGQGRGFSEYLKNMETQRTFKGDEASWFQNAQSKVKTFTDLKPQEWQNMIKDIDVSKANTTFGNFREGFMSTFKPDKMGARLSEGAVSAGISTATNMALAEDQTYEGPGVVSNYISTPIQGAAPTLATNVDNSYFLDPNYGMQWQSVGNYTTPGDGIYAKTMRHLVPPSSPSNSMWG